MISCAVLLTLATIPAAPPTPTYILETTDAQRIEATLNDGIPHLVLPKAATAKARKIELKPG